MTNEHNELSKMIASISRQIFICQATLSILQLISLAYMILNK